MALGRAEAIEPFEPANESGVRPRHGLAGSNAEVEAGLQRVALPRALGGLASPPLVAVEVYEELAGGEASLP